MVYLLSSFLILFFSLIYRNYELIQPLGSYAWSMLLALVVFEGIFRINNGFAKRIDWENKLVKRLILQFVLSSIYAIFWIIVVRIFVSYLFFEKDFIRLSDESIYLVTGLFIVALITTGDLGIYLFRKWRISLVEIEKYKKEKAEFHLGMLQAQINPHFLFNSLNTLSSLIYEDRETASEYTRELADVYRYVLDSRKKELVSLDEEKAFTESFINLYKIRFDQKLSFDFKIEDTSPYSIPPLIIQLLVEKCSKTQYCFAK